MTRLTYTLIFLAALHVGAGVQGQEVTSTDPGNAGADFALQGEYAAPGWGLQVVAQGEGAFRAMLYSGGLPGAGWNRNQRYMLEGSRDGGIAQLRNDYYSVHIHGRQAVLKDALGRLLGRLTKWVRVSPTLGLRPPAGAKVLFDGVSTDQFVNGTMTEEHLLRMGTMTKDNVGDFRLHLEFRLPYMPDARGQGRANSGVYIQQRYEVQILDSFGLDGLKNECGALYEQRPPNVNAALPPLTWQTYDIWFRQPRWSADGAQRLEPARITVYHNGIPIHWNYSLTKKTGGGKPEGPQEMPIALQDHGNPVVFRNIWMIPGQGEFLAPQPASVTVDHCPPRMHRLRRIFRCCR